MKPVSFNASFRRGETSITPIKNTLSLSLSLSNKQGSDSDDMSSFSPYEIDDAIQYINLGYISPIT